MALSATVRTWSAVRASRTADRSATKDEPALIDRFLRTDDEEAFEILVRRYKEKVFRLAASILGRGAESEAEDATQEVFVALLRQLRTFRGESAFSTWLYRMARNQIIDYRRRAVRRSARIGDDALRETAIDTAPDDPRRVAPGGRGGERLLLQVDRLPEPQRVVVFLHYWQDQSIAEISELLDLKPGTVKSHLYRARRQLSALLREGGSDE